MDSNNTAGTQCLALKVMRLTKPTFLINQYTPYEEKDLVNNSFEQAFKNDLSSIIDSEEITVSKFLTLPQNFGNIFLGEIFSCYLSIHNDSDKTCNNVLIKTELQTKIRTGLSSPSVIPELPPDQSIDDIINHEVKELGIHILVCNVQYLYQGLEKSFKKFYKFQVLRPLDVRTTFHNYTSDEMFLEAQIQNLTQNSMYLEDVTMHPSDNYDVKEHNAFQKIDTKLSRLINSQDIHQYLFQFKPKQQLYKDHQLLQSSLQIGKLDIIWRMSLGEKARLQTSPLQRSPPSFGDLRIFVEKLPMCCQIEKKCFIELKLINSSDRTMDLKLYFDQEVSQGLKWCGQSNHNLNSLQSNDSLFLTFTIFPIKLGIQMLSGLRILDTFLGRSHEFDDIAQIFIFNNNDEKLHTIINSIENLNIKT